MPIRVRGGKWHYRFEVNGAEFTASTDLVASEPNRIKAGRIEAKARELVLAGKQELLKIEVVRFDDAAGKYLDWARAEYASHPETARRLRTSFASLLVFFARQAITAITAGNIEDYKAWRRNEHGVKEVTIRHDLHALSGFCQYAVKHNWVRRNVVRDVTIPSDKDAVRIHVLTPAEEFTYFEAARRVSSLYDLGKLMIQHGCRPEEFLEMEKSAVDLERGTFRIVSGKTTAAKRTLKMTAEGREVFARRLRETGRFVFPGKLSGTHQKSYNFSHNKVLEITGLSFCVYDLRHTYATRMATLGLPIATLAAILGHANLRSIMKYVHIGEADIHAAMDRYSFETPVEILKQKDAEMVSSSFRPGTGAKNSHFGKITESTGKV